MNYSLIEVDFYSVSVIVLRSVFISCLHIFASTITAFLVCKTYTTLL